jgi:hypothetical protein
MVLASFRHTLFLTRVPKGTERFLMRRLASRFIFNILCIQKKSLYSLLSEEVEIFYSVRLEISVDDLV